MDPFFYNIKGEFFYYIKQDAESAFECWQKSVRLKSDYSEAYNNLAIYYLKNQKNLLCAEENIDLAMRYDPEESTYAVTKGEIIMQSGQKYRFFEYITQIEKHWKKNIDILKLKKRGQHEFATINEIS
jgi:tetratricopeptide (TPR) repeat protein